MSKFFLTIAFLHLVIAWPAISAAQVQLQYPQFPNIPLPDFGNLPDVLRYVYQIMLGLGFVLAIGFFIYGGLLFLTSFGNAARTSQAKALVLSALLGLFILFSSYAVLATIDRNLVIWDLRLILLRVPSVEPLPGTLRPGPLECQTIPLQKTFESIQELEKEAIRTAERIEPLLQPAQKAADNLQKIIDKCTCSKPGWQSECLIPDAGSAKCPGICPAALTDPPAPDEDPCPPEMRSQLIPALGAELTKFPELIALLESYNFDLTNQDEFKEELQKLLEIGFPEKPTSLDQFMDALILFIENKLARRLSNNDQERDKRIKEIRELMKKSLSVQLIIMENITRRLTEVRLEFERQKAQVRQFRTEMTQGTRNIFLCAEAKARGLIEKCNELDFYSCP